jgi:hypothetical protein
MLLTSTTGAYEFVKRILNEKRKKKLDWEVGGFENLN